MTADELKEKIVRIENNEWGNTVEGKIYAGVTLGSMFLLGILVSITPCALALMLTLTSYVASVGVKKKKTGSQSEKEPKPPTDGKAESGVWFGVSVALAFTLGIGLVFFLMGCIFTFVGFSIANTKIFYIIAGTILILFGIHNIFGMGLIYEKVTKKRLATIQSEKPDAFSKKQPKPKLFDRGRMFAMKIVDRYVLFGAFFLGMLLAVGWAPCALAFVFPALILVMTQQIPMLVGGLYLFIFSIGYGIPVVALAALTASIKAKAANKAINVGKWIPKIFGVIIITLGVIMIIRWFGIYLW
jgi:cytochrome c-type biogenesis protein